MRPKNYILFFFLEYGREQKRNKSKNDRSFSLQKQKKTVKNEIWEQFVRNSRHIMEPQLRFGYNKTHSTLFFLLYSWNKQLI